jgi:hypothetical protein
VVAPVNRIGGKFGKVHLIGIYEEVLNVYFLSEFPGRSIFSLRINGGSRRYGSNPTSAQNLPGYLEEKGAVDTSGKCNEHGFHLPEDLL